MTDVDGATDTATATLNIDATTPPVAAISATPNHVGVGEPGALRRERLEPTTGRSSRYEWDLDGNSTFETDTDGTATAARSYPQGAAVTVSVRVTDNDDRTAVASMQLIVDAPPAPPAAAVPGAIRAQAAARAAARLAAAPAPARAAARAPAAPAGRPRPASSVPRWAPRPSRA